MKRSIINGLLALALMIPVAGGFTACKDTDEDQFNQLQKDQYDLDKKIQELNTALEQLKQLQGQCQSNCETMIKNLLKGYASKDDIADMATKGDLANLATKEELDEYAKLSVLADYATKEELETYAYLKGAVATIEQTIQTIQTTLAGYDSRLGSLEDKTAAADLAISKINQTLSTVSQTITNMQSSLSTLETNLTNLSTKVDNMDVTIGGIQTNLTQLTTTVTEINNNLTTLTGTVTGMQQQIAPIVADWSTVKKQAYDAWAWVSENSTLFTSMQTTLDDLTKTKIPSMEKDIKGINDSIGTIKIRLDSAETHITKLQTNVEGLDSAIFGNGGLAERVAANEKNITALKNDVNALTNRLDSLVTGIILQGTVNPIFGSMSLPINVQSNILMAYYGYNDSGRNYEFPDDRTFHEFDNSIVITDADWEMLNQPGAAIKKFFTVNQGVIMSREDGNAGRVYVTVNPNNVNFNGVTLPIVNSQDEESGIKLTPLRKSDEVLTFGYSRAANNGFYEADATLTPENIEKVKVDIEPGLKSTLKDALTDRSKKDFAKLLKMVYDQFNGILPANGLKAGWKVNNVDYAVYSNYNLAATAFKPLSFKFLQGTSIRNLPTITPISGFEFDMSKFTFNIDMPDFVINTDDISMKLNLTFTDIAITYEGKIQVTIDDYPIVENGVVIGTETRTFTADGIDALITDINQSLRDALQTNADRWNKEIEEQFRTTMDNFAKQIKEQVDDMMDKVAGQINDKIKDVLTQIGDEVNDKIGNYINKANSLINRYNSAADRINEYLKNANNYLQVTMLVQGSDGMFHNVSNSASMPSPFVLAGGDALTLYLTTYTGEIVAPCLQKYVGVSNVFDANGNSAQAGDAACLSELKSANATEFMNTALSGDQRRVAFAGKAGYTYELIYQALDYHGFTSTRKFYVTVK